MKGNTVRILLFLLAASALVFTGCSDSGDVLDSNPGGLVRFTLSSSTAPMTVGASEGEDDCDDGDREDCEDGEGHGDRPQIVAANVTICGIVARNVNGELIDVNIELPYTVDLFALNPDGTATLPDGFLPPGTYDQLIMVMCEVQVTTARGYVITIDPPGGGWTAVIPTCPFTVEEGAETAVQIMFKHGRAFRWINGGLEFHPEFECDDDASVDPI